MNQGARKTSRIDRHIDPPLEGQPGNGNGHGTAALSFKLDVFEGPLDLLLFLIRKDEIDITDIPIAKITAEYLGLLRLMESCDLEVAGEYIVMAATLIRIKSAMLLPRDPEAEGKRTRARNWFRRSWSIASSRRARRS